MKGHFEKYELYNLLEEIKKDIDILAWPALSAKIDHAIELEDELRDAYEDAWSTAMGEDL